MNMSIYVIAMHQLLAHLVLLGLLRHGSKLVERPPVVEPVSSLQILHQPINIPLKVLLLDQIDLMYQGGLHLLL
jgi:hypothetical protein